MTQNNKKTILKGFPTEISDYIELPDIAELLTYPMFFDADIDFVYKYGSDFQRKLIDMAPLRNTKKVISVLSEVLYLEPGFRTCTGVPDDPFKEWHIDCEENENVNGKHIYHEERDIVHLLTNECTSMTEFNKNEIVLNWDYDRPYSEFRQFLIDNRDKINIIPQKMPHNRIVTFTNHLHRATNPKVPEFKYMFRIVETDRDRKPVNRVNNSVKITGKNGEILNIERQKGKIIIYFPSRKDG